MPEECESEEDSARERGPSGIVCIMWLARTKNKMGIILTAALWGTNKTTTQQPKTGHTESDLEKLQFL